MVTITVGILDDRPFTQQGKGTKSIRWCFYTSAGLILLFSLTTILFRDFSALWIGRTLDWVSKTFGWYYLLAATLYIVFVVCIACSRLVR